MQGSTFEDYAELLTEKLPNAATWNLTYVEGKFIIRVNQDYDCDVLVVYGTTALNAISLACNQLILLAST